MESISPPLPSPPLPSPPLPSPPLPSPPLPSPTQEPHDAASDGADDEQPPTHGAGETAASPLLCTLTSPPCAKAAALSLSLRSQMMQNHPMMAGNPQAAEMVSKMPISFFDCGNFFLMSSFPLPIRQDKHPKWLVHCSHGYLSHDIHVTAITIM